MIEYFVEVPNNGIQEPVRSLDDAYPLCYDLAQQFGFARSVGMLSTERESPKDTTPTGTNLTLSHLRLFVREEQCGGGLPPLYKNARYH